MNVITCLFVILYQSKTRSQSFPRSVGQVAMSSKNWFGPVKGYSLLVQMTNRNLSTSSGEYVNVL